MRCEQAQRVVSAALDDVTARVPAEIEEHARTCARCSAFRLGAWELRKAVRLTPAPEVPDLTEAIMERVAGAPEVARPPEPAGRRPLRRALALSLAAGLVAGFVLTGGGLVLDRRTNDAALASEIPHRLVQAAVGLDGYRATFDVVERNWSRAVPRRTFVAKVSFRAPEDFRVDVDDTTAYPSGEWMPNDLTLVTNGRTWVAAGPQPCPDGIGPPCPGRDAVLQRVTGRPPFDAITPMPTDLIVPMTVLAAADRVHVLGPGTVRGQDAVAVELAYQDARPLFASLQFLGSWRPLFPQDRVVVWLDRATWFPLRFEAFPAPGAERREWARHAGLPHEAPGSAVFSATIRTFSTVPAPRSAFAPRSVHGVPGGRPSVLDEGFREGDAGAAPAPEWTAGMRLVREGTVRRGGVAEAVRAYSSGLAWLTVSAVSRWDAHRPFGVGPFAEPVALPEGTGLYEPASSETGARRLSLHTSAGDVVLATNLPRGDLLRVAASLPVRLEDAPVSRQVHRWAGGVVRDGLRPDAALREAGFDALRPGWLPAGYRPAVAETVRAPGVRGVTVVYRRPAAELDGVGLRLYQAVGDTLPPPTSTDVQAVALGDVTARWSPARHELEWVAGGVYRSATAPSLDLTTLLRVAGSLGDGG